MSQEFIRLTTQRVLDRRERDVPHSGETKSSAPHPAEPELPWARAEHRALRSAARSAAACGGWKLCSMGRGALPLERQVEEHAEDVSWPRPRNETIRKVMSRNGPGEAEVVNCKWLSAEPQKFIHNLRTNPFHELLFQAALTSLPAEYRALLKLNSVPLKIIRPATRSLLKLIRAAIGPENILSDCAIARIERFHC